MLDVIVKWNASVSCTGSLVLRIGSAFSPVFRRLVIPNFGSNHRHEPTCTLGLFLVTMS